MNSWRKILVKILVVIFPGTDNVPGLDPQRTERFLVTFLGEAPLPMRLAFYGSSLAFLFSTPLTVGRLQPALSLRSKTLDRHANLAAAHSLYLMRQAMLLLKTVGGLCWGADPKVRRALGLRDYPSDPGTWKQA